MIAALCVLWAERLTVAAWRPASILMAGAALALLGLPALLPLWLHLAVLLAGLAACLAATLAGLRELRRPRRADAERRLEQDSGLTHRPFATLRDAPAAATPAQLGLWRIHQARARAALAGLRLRPPRPVLAARDPSALRALAVLLLASAWGVAGPQAGSRLALSLLPGMPGLAGGPRPAIQAWIEPPAYTGLAPIFLPAGSPAAGNPVMAPAGSLLTISITGLHRRPSITLPGGPARPDRIGPESFQLSRRLTASGRLSIGTFLTTLGSWKLEILPNEKPLAAWAALPGRAGTSLSIRLPWQVRQRWGVAALEAELRPQARPDLPALVLPLPLPGTPKAATGAATPDLSANPYAGLTVTGQLRVRDVSGQSDQSAPVDFVLPARAFHHPLARAIAG